MKRVFVCFAPWRTTYVRGKSLIVMTAILQLCVYAGIAQAALEPVVFSSQDFTVAPRWIYGYGELPKGNGADALLARAKRAQMSGDYKTCFDAAKLAAAKTPLLQAWISVVAIDCASRIDSTAANAQSLRVTLESLKNKPDLFIKGAAASFVRLAYAKGLLVSLERLKKFNRAQAWTAFEELQNMSTYLDEKMRASMYRSAGELAHLQQKTEAARDFYKRSLSEADSEEARSKLKALAASLEPSLKIQNPATSGTPAASSSIDQAINQAPNLLPNLPGFNAPGADAPRAGATPGNAALETTPAEADLVDRVTAALKAGDLMAAVTDGVKIIHDFPGGSRAKWATDRVFEAFTSVTDRSDPALQQKLQLVHQQMLSLLSKVDPDRLAEWSRILYNRGQWEDSLILGKKSLESMQGARTTKVLETSGEAALACDKFDVAQEIFTQLSERHAGTPSAREAMLRGALLRYRRAQYAQASTELEHLLSIPQIDNYELTARYWLWRSLQKLKSPRADAIADEMAQKFPFSYYGLRARFERNQNVLEWKTEATSSKSDLVKVETKLWLTSKEKQAWGRLQLLLKAGWLDEAQVELKDLPPVYRADDKAVRALMSAAAGNFVLASKLANEAWDDKPDLRRPPFTRSVFPNDYVETVTTQSTKRKLDRYLVQGLIKQESAYNVHAVSSSNAFGLMQMIGPTAREVAGELKLGDLTLPDDMFQPQRNIMMGTYYLGRLIAKYQGSVPLGLASYNAGPTRIDRWIKARPSLKGIVGLKSSSPDDELWFDEIPYNETSFYVKAILRNQLLYHVLEQGKIEIGNPIW